jgi:hypothetical protein
MPETAMTTCTALVINRALKRRSLGWGALLVFAVGGERGRIRSSCRPRRRDQMWRFSGGVW